MSQADQNEPTKESILTRPGWSIEEWEPTTTAGCVLNVLSIVVLGIGYVVFLVVAIFATGGALLLDQLEGLDGALIMVLLIIGVLAVHEGVHGLAMLVFGARPQFGVALWAKVLPVAYCTSPGHWFTRNQFIVIALAPLVVISILGVALMPIGNLAGWLIIPLAVNAGGAVGDIWFFGMLLRRSSGTLVEDLRKGMRFHYPPADSRDVAV